MIQGKGHRMKQAQLLDELARAIDAPRREYRLEDIKRAFAAYTWSLKAPWWKRVLTKLKEVKP